METDVGTTDDVVKGRNGNRIAVRDYTPRTPHEGARPLLWVHGGAFTSGGLDQDESHRVAHRIAAGGRPVRTVDYRLVPRWPLRGPMRLKPSDNRFPAAADDVVDTLLDLAATTAEGEIFVGGASAGACLTATAALRLRDEGHHAIRGLAFAYGTFHATLPPPPEDLRHRRRSLLEMIVGPDVVDRMNLNYAGSTAALQDPLAFPGGGPLTKLPPTLLLDADRDPFRASSASFAKELGEAGVDVTYALLAGSKHGFLDRPRSSFFDHGTRLVANWLTSHD